MSFADQSQVAAGWSRGGCLHARRWRVGPGLDKIAHARGADAVDRTVGTASRTFSDAVIHRWRLGSGVILFTYISLHMLNHALGLVSLAWAEAALDWAARLWQSIPGTLALYGAFAVHIALALRTIHQRRNWQLPPTEWFRLWSGFGLPLLLITHAVSTRVAATFYGFLPDYQKVVTSIIHGDRTGWQIALLAPGWVHGCLGLWIGLRRHPRIARAKPVLVLIMAAVPLLSAAGFIRMILIIETSPAFVAQSAGPVVPYADALATWREVLQIGYIALVLGAAGTGWWSRRMSSLPG